jgi:hypothetical protein
MYNGQVLVHETQFDNQSKIDNQSSLNAEHTLDLKRILQGSSVSKTLGWTTKRG